MDIRKDASHQPRPRPMCNNMINNPPPTNGDHNRDPNIKALKNRGFIHHGSTLPHLMKTVIWGLARPSWPSFRGSFASHAALNFQRGRVDPPSNSDYKG